MTTTKNPRGFRLPDPPDREPDDMTSYRQLTATSIIEPLRHYLGNLDTTLITGDQYLIEVATRNLEGSRYPDLMIAFDADLESHRSNNGYIIAEQGKPPDFVLEIASRSTGPEDVGDKRRDYARMGVREYWRFDETPTGRWHGARLAGDRLENGQYHPIPIEPLPGGILQGYSPILNVYLRWENGQLRWHDPATGRHIATFREEREGRLMAQDDAIREQERADRERDARLTAQDDANREYERANRERDARLQAEARARELEAELENLRNR